MRFVALVLAFSILSSFAQPAHAVTIGGEVYGSFNTYAMDDWNDGIEESNQTLGTNFDEISSGISGGIGARIWGSPNLLLAVAWEPLFASTDDADLEIKLDGNAFVGTVAYMMPVGTNAHYGIGAGGGFYSVSGEVSGPGGSVDIEGNTFGFHALGLAEWIVSPGFGITAGAGYRAANIQDTEIDGVVTSPEVETDYSGFTGRVGVVFYLPNGN